jgi:hypothetical protein
MIHYNHLFEADSKQPGHSAFCNVHTCPAPCGGSTSGATGREASPSIDIKASGKLRLRFNVDAGHYASSWWLHNRRSPFEIQHCKDDGHVCPQQGRHEAADSSVDKYGSRHVREHVDQ